MRVAGHSTRPSWASILTFALIGPLAVGAIELEIDNDSKKSRG